MSWGQSSQELARLGEPVHSQRVADEKEPSLRLGTRIERIRGVQGTHRVPVSNSSDAEYAVSADGRYWVRKKVAETGIEPLVAEALALLLGAELDVPVPAGGVTGEGEDLAWLSEWVPHAQHWDGARSHFVTNVDDLGSMLALDVWLLNEDRHRGNILLQPEGSELRLRCWSIDFGNALAGWPRDFAQRIDDVPNTRNLAAGLPVSRIAESAIECAAVAATLGKDLLAQLVAEVAVVAAMPSDDAHTLEVALTGRQNVLVERVTQFLHRLGFAK